MDIIDPKSERGRQMIRNAAFEKPTTLGDPSPPAAVRAPLEVSEIQLSDEVKQAIATEGR